MGQTIQHQPFAEIIQRALAARGQQEGDNQLHSDCRVPNYVVSMCKALRDAINQQSATQTTLAAVLRLEGTCTGADYAQKLALRCHKMVD